MRHFVLLLGAMLVLLLVFGCSQSPVTSDQPTDLSQYELVQRPEFVDLRPADVIAAHTVVAKDPYDPMAQKKPVKPPPDPDPGGEDPNPNPAHKYALVIGISDYEGTANDLQYCDDDAREMKAYLQSQGFSCQLILDRQATADNVEAGLIWLMNAAAPGDEIALCYSGHGGKAPGYGSSMISTDLYYLTHGWVMQYFNAANCTKKTVVIDACVIGDFHTDCQTGTFMATASNKTDSYDAPGLNNGAYTYYWLEGAEGQGFVFHEDIAPYAEDGMAAWAAIYHVRVSPKHTDRYDGSFDI